MMKKLLLIIISLSCILCMSLQEAYDDAISYDEYDKYLILDSNITYTGGLGIYEGNVFIDCNGAIIDLQEGQGIWLYADEEYNSSLDIQHCSIVNGLYYGLSFGGISTGNIYNCNFHSTNFGLKLFDESAVYITNSVFINQQSMGIGIYTELPNITGDYLLFWNNEDDCLENCPGWGNIWTQLELIPGSGIIYEDPLFVDVEHFNFTPAENSPCINSGNPLILNEDGSISDLGAIIYTSNECSINGDLNGDGILDVLDIVSSVCITMDPFYCESQCSGDMNNDGVVNVLDIVIMVNIILS